MGSIGINAPLNVNSFVGRERELCELKSAFTDAEKGQGGVVVLTGEAGIGKSRLSEESINSYRMKSSLLLRARCREARGTPPYWPWT
ncbi:MAG: ATP-binding protein [Dehalococcoidia bacterium]|nr:ATP-binding protein [Dehalococcoidia bacterium]